MFEWFMLLSYSVYHSLNSEVLARGIIIFSGVGTVSVICSLLSGHIDMSLMALCAMMYCLLARKKCAGFSWLKIVSNGLSSR